MNSFYTKTEIKFTYSIKLDYDPADKMRGGKLSFMERFITFLKDKMK